MMGGERERERALQVKTGIEIMRFPHGLTGNKKTKRTELAVLSCRLIISGLAGKEWERLSPWTRRISSGER